MPISFCTTINDSNRCGLPALWRLAEKYLHVNQKKYEVTHIQDKQVDLKQSPPATDKKKCPKLTGEILLKVLKVASFIFAPVSIASLIIVAVYRKKYTCTVLSDTNGSQSVKKPSQNAAEDKQTETNTGKPEKPVDQPSEATKKAPEQTPTIGTNLAKSAGETKKLAGIILPPEQPGTSSPPPAPDFPEFLKSPPISPRHEKPLKELLQKGVPLKAKPAPIVEKKEDPEDMTTLLSKAPSLVKVLAVAETPPDPTAKPGEASKAAETKQSKASTPAARQAAGNTEEVNFDWDEEEKEFQEQAAQEERERALAMQQAAQKAKEKSWPSSL